MNINDKPMNTIDGPIHVAFVSDRNYFDFVLIAVTSMLHYHRNGKIVIHLIHPDLSDMDLSLMHEMQKVFSFEFEAHHLDKNQFAKGFGISRPILWRLAIPELISEADRIIYLDCDLVFCDDILKLWSFDLRGMSIAAVGDRVGRKVTTPCLNPLKYFNSGVMLWDLKQMREKNAMKQWQTVFREHNCRLQYADQTLLNLVHRDDSILLPQNWNLHNSIYRNLPLEGMYTIEETIDAIRNPGIVHFTGHHKPWIFWKFTHHPYANRFWHFALQAPISPWLKAKFRLKRLFFGRLHEPKCQRPWNSSDIKRKLD